jgi:hypothetical protein
MLAVQTVRMGPGAGIFDEGAKGYGFGGKAKPEWGAKL